VVDERQLPVAEREEISRGLATRPPMPVPTITTSGPRPFLLVDAGLSGRFAADDTAFTRICHS
jgi:hypothetical protein